MPRVVAMLVGLLASLAICAACNIGASRGTMPPADANGHVDPSAVPDFVGYVGQTDHVIGWVPKSYFLDPAQHCTGPQCDPIPVYADDLTTLIGHDVPGRGFVPVGVDPATVPALPVQVGPSAAIPSP